jgi:hypothetical protein
MIYKLKSMIFHQLSQPMMIQVVIQGQEEELEELEDSRTKEDQQREDKKDDFSRWKALAPIPRKLY